MAHGKHSIKAIIIITLFYFLSRVHGAPCTEELFH